VSAVSFRDFGMPPRREKRRGGAQKPPASYSPSDFVGSLIKNGIFAV
jgi:hypothetical protein